MDHIYIYKLSSLLKVMPLQFLSEIIKSFSMIHVCYKVGYTFLLFSIA